MSKKGQMKLLLEYYLGPIADFFLERELEEIGITDLEHLDEEQVSDVIRHFVAEVFMPVVSMHQALKIRHKMCDIFHVREELVH